MREAGGYVCIAYPEIELLDEGRFKTLNSNQ